MSPEYSFIPARVQILLEAKGLAIRDLVQAGFNRNWIQGKRQPKAPDAVRLAAWLEVSTEFLFGAAPEYDGLEGWEVASRASLDIFLKRDAEGRRASAFRAELERHIDAVRESAPRTITHWRAALDLFARGRGSHADEGRNLRQLMEGEDPTGY